MLATKAVFILKKSKFENVIELITQVSKLNTLKIKRLMTTGLFGNEKKKCINISDYSKISELKTRFKNS